VKGPPISVFAAILTAALSVQSAFCQTERGDIELSIAASFMSTTGPGIGGTQLHVPIRLGFFVTSDLEIELETLFSKYEEEDVGYIVSGNLVGHFALTDEQEDLVPMLFASGGYGFTNTALILPNIVFWGDPGDGNSRILNLGAGWKMFMPSQSVALRLEYRYYRFFSHGRYYRFFSHGRNWVNHHLVLLGFSLFL